MSLGVLRPILPHVAQGRKLLTREMRNFRHNIGRAARQFHAGAATTIQSNASINVHPLRFSSAQGGSAWAQRLLSEPEHAATKFRELQQEIPAWPVPYWEKLTLEGLSLSSCISKCQGQGFRPLSATIVVAEEMLKRNMQLVDEYAGRHLPNQLKTGPKVVWRMEPMKPQHHLPRQLKEARSLQQLPLKMRTDPDDCIWSKATNIQSTECLDSDTDSIPPPPPVENDEAATVYSPSCNDSSDAWIMPELKFAQYGSAKLAKSEEPQIPRKKRESGRIRQRRKRRLEATPGTDDDSF